jgi:LmbE family N-acetylglucosaminyl deacetylase
MKMDCATDLKPQSQSLASRYAGKTVVAIGAHPDDLEIGIGGTLAKLRRDGAKVVMVVASIPKDFDVRLEEAKRGAEILGCELRLLMDKGPQRIEDVKTCDLVGMLDGVIREYKPAAVLTHSNADFHNDHLIIYNACMPTQRLAPFDFYSYHPTNCRPGAGAVPPARVRGHLGHHRRQDARHHRAREPVRRPRPRYRDVP